MEGFLTRYRWLLERIERVERTMVISLLAIMVGCIFGQVVSRYLFGLPLVWVEELSTYAFIWGVFIGASLGLKKKRHIKILSFVSRLSVSRQAVFLAVTDAMITLFCLILVVNGFKAMTLFEWSQRTIALPVELPRVLFYSTPLILGAASMALTAAHDFLGILFARRQVGSEGTEVSR